MPNIPSRLDVVVIGAGAAGIAAAREAQRLGLDVLIVEARDRLGGRAHTSSCGTPFLFDLGCAWLHSADRNVLAALAPELGFRVDKSDPPWRRRHPQRGFGEADYEAFEREQVAFYARLEQAAVEARVNGRDRAASTLLNPAARWNGFADAISTYYNGAPFERVSVLDFDAYVDTEVNWRVEGGYGAMIAAAARDLPVALNHRVTAVEADRAALRIVTDAGVLETGAVIVTVSTSVLAAGAIRFPPALDAQLHAAAGLPCGVADKVYFALEDAKAFAPDMHLIGDPGHRDCGSYTLRAAGRPIVEGYFGGDYARALEKGGLDAFTDAARREIGRALGRDVGAALKPIAATSWAQDPYALGSYSHALPGHAGDRAVLATPLDARILFAGEATSPHFFSTAHGAFEEGIKAARALAPAGLTAAAGGHR